MVSTKIDFVKPPSIWAQKFYSKIFYPSPGRKADAPNSQFAGFAPAAAARMHCATSPAAIPRPPRSSNAEENYNRNILNFYKKKDFLKLQKL